MVTKAGYSLVVYRRVDIRPAVAVFHEDVALEEFPVLGATLVVGPDLRGLALLDQLPGPRLQHELIRPEVVYHGDEGAHPQVKRERDQHGTGHRHARSGPLQLDLSEEVFPSHGIVPHGLGPLGDLFHGVTE